MAQNVHYVYRTTNMVNGKIYVGVRSAPDPNLDDYLGSGSVLRAAISKYGRAQFAKEILAVFESRDAAFAMEREIVSEEFVASPETYNVRAGGSGGWDYVNKHVPHSQKVDVSHIDWMKAQEMFDSGMSREKLAHELGLGKKVVANAIMRGDLIGRNRAQAQKARYANLSPEEKSKLSAHMSAAARLPRKPATMTPAKMAAQKANSLIAARRRREAGRGTNAGVERDV